MRFRARVVPVLLAAAVGAAGTVVGTAGCSTRVEPVTDEEAAGVAGSPRPPAKPPAASPSASPTPRPTDLPRGGRRIFPDWRVVAHYGAPNTGQLGVLGEGPPAAAVKRLLPAAKAFEAPGGRRVLPAFELIATVANASPGKDGSYSTPTTDAKIAPYLAAAREAKALLVLDVQPGRGDPLAEVRRYERWLREPDVGLAIDPEWTMPPGQVPGKTIGRVTAAQVNSVSGYLAGLVSAHKLPEKLFVVHQFRASMVQARSTVARRPGLATVFHIDGFGTPDAKKRVYAALKAPPGFFNGFKLFLDEDTPTLTPAQAMGLAPKPDLITYQ